jgi:hypothetical protein
MGSYACVAEISIVFQRCQLKPTIVDTIPYDVTAE